MHNRDIFTYAFSGMAHRGLRSWLTILGIVIGVSAIVLLISISFGLDAQVKGQFAFFGQDMISIIPGGKGSSSSMGGLTGGGHLTEEDVKAIAKLPGVQEITYLLLGYESLEYKGERALLIIGGTEAKMAGLVGLEIETGRFPLETEHGVAVVGHGLAYDTFDKDVQVGQHVTIANRSFKVIGIMAKGGNLIATFSDKAAFIPIADGREILSQFKNNKEVSRITLRVKQGTKISDVSEDIAVTLRRLHKVSEDKEDFTIVTSDYMMERINSVFSLLTIFLGGIASISLLVGGIGIANTMFMSVTERTREIGILKAIGASQAEIRNIFLIESGLIGFTGGFIGVAIAFALSYVITVLGFPSLVPWWLALFGIMFSFLVGMLSGYVPASQAAKLNPIEALRYEH